MPNIISIGSSAIRQIDGLYSLNDLHKASGSLTKHQPALFIRLDQTKALIAEISSTDMQSLKTVIGKGKEQGTYACKELVIAYAAWISSAFHLQVIRVFLAKQTQQTEQPLLPLKPNLNDTRWHLRFSDEGRPHMEPLKEGSLLQTREDLIENILKFGGMATMFNCDYVQRLATACINRLNAEVHYERANGLEVGRILKATHERHKVLEAKR